jgi:hypothetical protein
VIVYVLYDKIKAVIVKKNGEVGKVKYLLGESHHAGQDLLFTRREKSGVLQY